MSAGRSPRVTVFIPAYNAQSYIAQAADSVLAQSFTDFELLLIDDASTDDTPAIMDAYRRDPRVRVIHHLENMQRPRTRSEGVAQARGEYIALLDADDRFMPDRLAKQVAYLDTHRQIDAVGSWWHRIDAHGRTLAPKKRRRYLSPDAIEAWLLFRCVIHNPTVMARRAVLAAYPYDPAFPIAEDYDVWARMLGHHRFAIMPAPLTCYREHAAQASTAQAKASLYYRQRVQARQLESLGIAFNDQDLRYHSLLYTGRALFRAETGHDMDRDYVRWAGQWLERLVAANAKQRRYPRPALSRLTARLWWFACRKATKQGGAAVWRDFAASPLSRRLPRAWLYDLSDAAQRRQA
ncbi:family 2 glycosyl transferase [Salinisphaera sp. T5B8]|uniref:glycosyltransferase family 2 protein n=1 Tax=Salinisphaera sp. T5B8 TaxID=1304154 RepID=UPI00333F11F5